MDTVVIVLLALATIFVALRAERKQEKASLPSQTPLNKRETRQQLEEYLDHESWEYRYHAFQQLLKHFRLSPKLLLKGLRDPHHYVRREAFAAIEWRLRIPHHVRLDAFLHGDNPQFVDALSCMLDDPQARFRKKAVNLLRRSHHQASIGPLMKAMGDPDKGVRKAANRAFQQHRGVIQEVTFDHRPFEVQQAGKALIVLNPDVSHVQVPLSHLRSVYIFTEQCDHKRVRIFAAYLLRQSRPRWLKKHLHMIIHGNPLQLPSAVWSVCTLCQHVETDIDSMYFGANVPQNFPQHAGTLVNPDVSLLQLPLWRLKTVVIDLKTHDFHAIEYFITYAMQYLGAKHCQQHMAVYLLGKDPNVMHTNLRNNLTSLCKTVEMSEVWKREKL